MAKDSEALVSRVRLNSSKASIRLNKRVSVSLCATARKASAEAGKSKPPDPVRNLKRSAIHAMSTSNRRLLTC